MANPSAVDDISAVLRRGRDRETERPTKNFLYHYQRTTTRSLLAKLETRLGQVALHEKTRVCTATSTWTTIGLGFRDQTLPVFEYCKMASTR